MRLTRRRRRIQWYKWEQKLLERFLKADQEQALTADGDGNEWYYSYWDCPDAHLPVLQDAPYQAAWAAALEAAAPLLRDTVVLDVGCGLGTLAMAAARAGAKHVYAVDASQGAAEMARRVVAANGLANKVTVLHGRAELIDLPVRRVDVILCDWMGSMLLHDSLLPALIYVRDRWLAPDGVILPDSAQLHVTGIDDRLYLSEQTKLWGSRPMGPVASPAAAAAVPAAAAAAAAAAPGGSSLSDGFSMKAVLNAVIKHPRVADVPRGALVTDTQQLLDLDLHTVKLQDLRFRRRVQLTARRPDRISGLAVHFDVAWRGARRGSRTPAAAMGQPQQQPPGGDGGAPVVTFSTAPTAPATSWLQTVLSFPKALRAEAGQALGAEFVVSPVGAPPGRMLDVNVEVEFQGLRAAVAYQLKR